ncbi:hypothetical protein PCIT_b0157 [Pseudoalteromonas citrea]|uniref:Antibiotic biosynthesis monooxygenase n=2 Tax=Pseudoalteromonas citrea TaxID=43655 RepID=A0AAD4FPN5_9GAMM|nr:hypothetical protein [Pseudoalteromonas citrea]KAF7764221.1 hypothetical protein PCIT_b0157 [Pseudoalteromonas citrea]
MTNPIIEVVTFALAEGVTEQDFMSANSQFETFLNAQSGLLYRSLAKQQNSALYIDVIYWETLHDATRVQQAFYDSPECQSFIKYIDKDTVELTHNRVIAQTECNN